MSSSSDIIKNAVVSFPKYPIEMQEYFAMALTTKNKYIVSLFEDVYTLLSTGLFNNSSMMPYIALIAFAYRVYERLRPTMHYPKDAEKFPPVQKHTYMDHPIYLENVEKWSDENLISIKITDHNATVHHLKILTEYIMAVQNALSANKITNWGTCYNLFHRMAKWVVCTKIPRELGTNLVKNIEFKSITEVVFTFENNRWILPFLDFYPFMWDLHYGTYKRGVYNFCAYPTVSYENFVKEKKIFLQNVKL